MMSRLGDPQPDSSVDKDVRSSGDSLDQPSAATGSQELRRQILGALEEHRVAEELLLRRHQAALRDALERVFLAAEPPHTALPADASLVYQTSSEVRPTAASGPPGSTLLAQGGTGSGDTSRDGHEARPAISGRLTWLHQTDSSSTANTSKFVSTLIGSRRKLNVTAASLCRQRLGAMIQHPAFDSLIGCLIVLNTVVMFVQLEAEAPSQEGGRFMRPTSDVAFGVFSHIFNAIFLVELLIRLYVQRCPFFQKAFNWIETLIVVLTLVDAYVLPMIQDTSRQNISFMYIVRFIRVVRAMRVIRTLNLFRSLRVLINTIALCFQSLFWSMLILLLFMLMFALFMCQMLSGFIVDESEADNGMKQWAFRFYGSPFRALWTVFEITFSGCWPNYARPLVESVDAYYAVFFAIYITAVVVATVRIVFALFLKDTLQSAASDAEMIVAEKMKEMEATRIKLSEMFREADESGDGYLSAEELEQIMRYPKVKVWMHTLGLDVSDTRLLFQLLDDGDGRISYDEFVNGIMRLKGNSRSIDTINIMRDCQRMSKHCEATRVACEQVLAALGVRGTRMGQEPGLQRLGSMRGAAAATTASSSGRAAGEGAAVDLRPRGSPDEVESF